jgi:hypothetical protein
MRRCADRPSRPILRIGSRTSYATNVFINSPFDGEFEPLFHAIVFAVIQCGYTVRCGLEAEEGGRTVSPLLH